MKVIELTKGQVTIVDDEDFEHLAQYRWHFIAGGYAVRTLPRVPGETRKTVYMHREILKPTIGLEVDHINRNKLDNRRCNLRLATKSENGCNKTCCRNSKTGIKGVFWNTEKGKYTARIERHAQVKHLGHFTSIEEAKRAYNEAAILFHGEFAKLN